MVVNISIFVIFNFLDVSKMMKNKKNIFKLIQPYSLLVFIYLFTLEIIWIILVDFSKGYDIICKYTIYYNVYVKVYIKIIQKYY